MNDHVCEWLLCVVMVLSRGHELKGHFRMKQSFHGVAKYLLCGALIWEVNTFKWGGCK